MFKVPMDVFAYTNEAAVMARGGRIVYANGAARMLLGTDCEGKKIGAVLGPEIAEAQASNFVADFCKGGRHYSVRATRQEDGQFYFFSQPDVKPGVLSEAFIYSLRSNLMNMNLAMELCRAKAEEQGNQELLDGLRELCRSQFRMSRLASNVDMLKNAPTGDNSFSTAPVDIGRLCRECVECVEGLFENVEFRLSAQDGVFIAADAALVKKLLMNLISNCLIHATGLSRISISVVDSADFVLLSVSDDGCGISGEQLHRVFDRYCHVYEMAEMNSGAGIGLSIVRLAAQLHGGTLLLESKEGYGTTARVSLKKNTALPLTLHSGQEEHFDIATALIELSDCLDSKFYGEKFMD